MPAAFALLSIGPSNLEPRPFFSNRQSRVFLSFWAFRDPRHQHPQPQALHLFDSLFRPPFHIFIPHIMSAIRTTIAAPARLALRRSAPRRYQSTSSSTSSTSTSTSTTASDAAAKARQAAADVSSKAAEGLSRVQAAAGPALAAAGPAIAGAAKGLTTALGRVGGRTGKAINFIESMSTQLCSLPTCPLSAPC